MVLKKFTHTRNYAEGYLRNQPGPAEARFRNKKLNSPKFNRYRRGLETCPQAKTSIKGHAIFFSFFPTRPRLGLRATSMTQRRVENTRVHFWTFLPVSVREVKN